MHIKRFEAASVKEALARIRGELGPDALILESRRVDDGSGWFEVTAALPHAGSDRARAAYAAEQRMGRAAVRPATRVPAASTPAASTPAASTPAASTPATSTPAAGVPSAGTAPGAAPATTPPPARPAGTAGGGGSVSAKVAEILSRLPRESVAPALSPDQQRRFLGESSEESGSEVAQLRVRAEYLSRLIRSEHFSAIPLPLRELYLELSEAEVDANLVFQILSRMGQAPMPGHFQPAPLEGLLPRLEAMISVGGDVRADDPRRVLAVVGPTGVGKTTTLAKIAGQAAFGLGKRVALVSTDAYRIFGAEHLGSYAALMGLPFATAGTSDEIAELLDVDFADCDLVLVDTSGRSPRDPRGIDEIHEILSACPDLDIHLVLAANARVRDMAFALEGFSRLPIGHLIFTKIDETTRRGGLFTVALKARRPVAYLGTGQEVPDDLLAATTRFLTEGISAREEATRA